MKIVFLFLFALATAAESAVIYHDPIRIDARIQAGKPVLEWSAIPRVNYAVQQRLWPNGTWITVTNVTVETEGTNRIQIDPVVRTGNTQLKIAAATAPAVSAGLTTYQVVASAANPGDTVTIDFGSEHPLSEILQEQGCSGFYDMISLVKANPIPRYQSTKTEVRKWAGFVSGNPFCGMMYMFIHMDDGCRVTLNGKLVGDWLGPRNWNDLDSSFFYVACMDPATQYITVEYQNLSYGGSGDRDGVTLWVISDGDSYLHPRIVGPTTNLVWFNHPGQPVEFFLDAVAYDIVWSTSANLKIVATNETLQSISVVPIGGSSVSFPDEIRATSRSPGCWPSPGPPAVRQVIIEKPTSLVEATPAFIMKASGFTSTRYWYNILNQYGTVMSVPCFASEFCWGPVPASTILCPAGTNVTVAVNGTLSDFLFTPLLALPFVRYQAVYAHDLPWNSDYLGGVLIRINRLNYNGSTFIAEPVSKP